MMSLAPLPAEPNGDSLGLANARDSFGVLESVAEPIEDVAIIGDSGALGAMACPKSVAPPQSRAAMNPPNVFASTIRTDLLEKVPDPLSGDNPRHPLLPEDVPPVGVPYSDQYFGTTLTRVTQTEGYQSRHEYSRIDPFNVDRSLIVLLPEWNWRVFRATSMPYNQADNLVLTLDDVEDPRWDPVNPNLLWGLKGFTIVNVDVTNGEETVVKDFTQDPTIGPMIQNRPSLYRITMQNEGECSYDMRYWAFMLQDGAAGQYRPRYVFCWDRQANQVLGVTSLTGTETAINWIGMSPLGNYVVYGGEGAGGRFEGLTISDRSMTQFRQMDANWGHSDVGLDVNGNEVIIGQTVADGQDRIDMIQMNLQTPARTPLIRLYYDNESPIGFNSGVHISGNCNGWAVVSTEIGPGIPDQNWLDRTITLARLDPVQPDVWYLAKVTNTTQEYWEETQASVTRDGSKVVWASNGGQNIGQEQMFLMELEVPTSRPYPNNPPEGADRTVSTLEDSTYVLAMADFGFTDPGDAPPDLFKRVCMTTLPTAGSLLLNGEAVTAGQFVNIVDIASGRLTFSPAADANGDPYAAFTFQVEDDGGTDNGGANLDPTPNTLTIRVTAVNDPPSFAAADPPAVDQDAEPQVVAGWVTSFSPGPADESWQQAMRYIVSEVSNPSLFSTPPAVSPNGTLTYTPAGFAYGTSTFKIAVQDDGGTEQGGWNTSDARSYRITVNPVNPRVRLPDGRGTNRVVVSLNGQNVQVVNNNKRPPLVDLPLGSFRGLTILGADNKTDRVLVDLPNAAASLPDGIVLEGGAGKKAVDKLTLRGAAAGGTFTFHAGAGPGAGTAAMGDLGIQFSGLEQVRFEGLAGNDTYAVSALPVSLTVNDTGGVDTVDFSGETGGVGVSFSLATSSARKVFGGTTTLTLKGKFEDATGTPYADKITGNSAANLIRGLGGDDRILGGAGNDTLYGGHGNDWLYGDAGNDILFGQLGNNVLLGGVGNDQLDVDIGVEEVLTGRNLLIGGKGLDTLTGGVGEEILIGSTTKYDRKPLALTAIMEEWASDASFDLRQTHLTDGITVPGNPKAGLIQLVRKDKLHPKGTVLDDGSVDQLLGGLGDDWFFAFGTEVPNDG